MKSENIQKLKEIHMDEFDMPEKIAELCAKVNGRCMEEALPELLLTILIASLKRKSEKEDEEKNE